MDMKIVLVGNYGIGKTEFMNELSKETDQEREMSCMDELDFELSYQDKNIKCNTMFVSGTADYSQVRPIFYMDSSIIGLCFSYHDSGSFETAIIKWHSEVRQFNRKATVVLLGLNYVNNSKEFHHAFEDLLKSVGNPNVIKVDCSKSNYAVDAIKQMVDSYSMPKPVVEKPKPTKSNPVSECMRLTGMNEIESIIFLKMCDNKGTSDVFIQRMDDVVRQVSEDKQQALSRNLLLLERGYMKSKLVDYALILNDMSIERTINSLGDNGLSPINDTELIDAAIIQEGARGFGITEQEFSDLYNVAEKSIEVAIAMFEHTKKIDGLKKWAESVGIASRIVDVVLVKSQNSTATAKKELKHLRGIPNSSSDDDLNDSSDFSD